MVLRPRLGRGMLDCRESLLCIKVYAALQVAYLSVRIKRAFSVLRCAVTDRSLLTRWRYALPYYKDIMTATIGCHNRYHFFCVRQYSSHADAERLKEVLSSGSTLLEAVEHCLLLLRNLERISKTA